MATDGSLKILGSGTSTGVPVPGCACAVCRSGKEKNQRLRSSALISFGDRRVIIDSSPDLRQQALRWNITHIDAVLYTHEHADHTAGIDDLRGFCFIHHTAIPCYGTRETLDKLRHRFTYIFNPDPQYQGGLLPQLALTEIKAGILFDCVGMPVLPFCLTHGHTAVTGFRFGTLGYATDCNFMSTATKEALRGVATLVIGALRFEPHPTHFTIPQAIVLAEELGAARTILTHTTHTIEYDEISAKLPKGVELAYDGLDIPFTV